MTNILDDKAERYPGITKAYAIFWRRATSHNPTEWRMLGRPTTEHNTLREMMMPTNMIDSNMYGIGWIDSDTDTEYKIMEMTVTRSEWRNESPRD